MNQNLQTNTYNQFYISFLMSVKPLNLLKSWALKTTWYGNVHRRLCKHHANLEDLMSLRKRQYMLATDGFKAEQPLFMTQTCMILLHKYKNTQVPVISNDVQLSCTGSNNFFLSKTSTTSFDEIEISVHFVSSINCNINLEKTHTHTHTHTCETVNVESVMRWEKAIFKCSDQCTYQSYEV